MKEMYNRNLLITREYKKGKKISELAREYKLTEAGLRRIVKDTLNKYPNIISQ